MFNNENNNSPIAVKMTAITTTRINDPKKSIFVTKDQLFLLDNLLHEAITQRSNNPEFQRIVREYDFKDTEDNPNRKVIRDYKNMAELWKKVVVTISNLNIAEYNERNNSIKEKGKGKGKEEEK